MFTVAGTALSLVLAQGASPSTIESARQAAGCLVPLHVGQDVPGVQDKQANKDEHAQIQKARGELAKAVARAHRSGPATAVIDRFKALIAITALGKDQDNVTIALDIKYGAAIERAKGRTMPMILYTIKEGDKRLQRGIDRRGSWQAVGGKVHGLRAKEYETDARLLAAHLRLCKQMLRFLEPGKILAALVGNEMVKDTTLRLGGGRKVAALYVRGRNSQFPIFRGKQVGLVAQGSVFMEVWVDKKTSRLLAVQVFPLPKGGLPDFERGEFVKMSNYVARQGILLPKRLSYYETDGKTRLQKAQIDLKQFRLNPELGKQDFERPAK